MSSFVQVHLQLATFLGLSNGSRLNCLRFFKQVLQWVNDALSDAYSTLSFQLRVSSVDISLGLGLNLNIDNLFS